MNDFLDLFSDKLFLYAVILLIFGQILFYITRAFKDELTVKKNKEDKNKVDFSQKLAKLYEESEQEKNTTRYYKTLNKELPLKIRLKNTFRELVTDKYLGYSPQFIFFTFAGISTVIVVVGFILTRNLIVVFPLTLVGILLPYLVFKARSLDAQLKIKDRNCYILSSIVVAYNSAPSLSEAFKGCRDLFKEGSDEQSICETIYNIMSGVPLYLALESFKKVMDADNEVSKMVDNLFLAEKELKQYKDSIEYLVSKYNLIIRSNRRVLNYMKYLICTVLLGMIAIFGTLFYLRFLNPEAGYYLFVNPFGMTGSFILFMIFFIVTLKTSKQNTLVTFGAPTLIRTEDGDQNE